MLLVKQWQQYSRSQLAARPCEQTRNQETRRSSVGGFFFPESTFLSLLQGQREG